MISLKDIYTSTGAKFMAHQEAMTNLRNGRGQAITTHIMCSDVCNHSCAFCSVQKRAGDALPLEDIFAYLDILLKYKLKSCILSGGGNPILYKCPKTSANFNHLVDGIHSRGLEIGLITNGVQLKNYGKRFSWKTVHPDTLDKITWIRISMAGLDHEENEVYVPDIDQSKTTLGFSYVFHDIYEEPADPYHGKVSAQADRITLNSQVRYGEDRIPKLTEQIDSYVRDFQPRYVRLLPNCLEVDKIADRCVKLQEMADKINPDVVFVQYKPPAPPNVCYLGYIHPVLNCDGYVYPCDSCVLNEAADHQFNKPWRVCHWSEVAKIYTEPVRSLVDPQKLCPGCVFTGANLLLESVRNGMPTPAPAEIPEHVNFV